MTNLAQVEPTVTTAANARLQQFFARKDRGRIILTIDATASRQPT